MMECPYCKKEIEGQDVTISKGWYYFICNVFVYSVPLMVIGTWLNNRTNIPLSVEDGLSWNIYMLPVLIVGLLLVFYSLLYSKGKVKGRFLMFK